MPSQTFKTVLVIGDDHETKIKLYSQDTKVEKWLYAKASDAQKLYDNRVAQLKMLSTISTLPDSQREMYILMLEDILECSADEYYQTLTQDCELDENGDAWTVANPNAKYKYERCPQRRLETTGEESAFANPFKLKDGSMSYIAEKGDIDWSLMHMHNSTMYERAWEMVVEGSKPKGETEERIAFHMGNRRQYFDNFQSKEDYVRHSCSFWCYGIICKDGSYAECSGDGRSWVAEFFEKYIKPLPDNALLSIYEVRSL